MIDMYYPTLFIYTRDFYWEQIALLNMENKYCMRWIRGGQPRLIDTLTASANGVEPLAVMEVEEAVREREIYDIRYNLEDVRIYNVEPWIDGNLVRDTYNTTAQTVIKRVGFTQDRLKHLEGPVLILKMDPLI